MFTSTLTMLSFFLILSIANASTEIYKTTDKQGRTVYTDAPSPTDSKSEVVELKNINLLPTPAIVGKDGPKGVEIIMTPYQLSILAPDDGTSLTPEDRDLVIDVGINQELNADHFIGYFLDGTLLKETRDTRYTLNEPPRGEHSIYAEVRDKAGTSFAKSGTVKVIVMRPIIKPKAVPVPKKH
jgi:Domain of unknown function (DUF4124)